MDISLAADELDLWTDSELSLYSFLNCSQTKEGGQKLLSWVKSPLQDIQEINERLNIVQFFGEKTELRLALSAKLRKTPPVTASITKFSSTGRPPKLKNCVSYLRFSEHYTEILGVLSGCPFFLEELELYRPHIEKLIDFLKNSINLELKSLEDEYKIDPRFDPTLQNIHAKIEECKSELESFKVSTQKMLGLSNPPKLAYMESCGFVFEFNKKEFYDTNKDHIEISFSVQSHLQRTVKVTCSELKALSKEHDKANNEYLAAQIDFEKKIIETTSTYTELIKGVKEIYNHLDAVLAISHACFTARKEFTRPFFNQNNKIIINKCRHPVLEQSVEMAENSIVLEKLNNSFLLITGPNMGGKSTYIRSICITVIMAHIGCFVPADHASICLVDSVCVMIGAQDSTVLGQSTFMSEMVKLNEIYVKATKNSMIAIDELGKGTSTSNGVGISQSVCEYFSELGCFSLFSTHFSELQQIDIRNFKVCKTEVLIKSKGIEFTHIIKDGPAELSYGIEIAKMFGMPDEVVSAAKIIKGKYED